jgi:hypothetical protein
MAFKLWSTHPSMITCLPHLTTFAVRREQASRAVAIAIIKTVSKSRDSNGAIFVCLLVFAQDDGTFGS